MDVKFSRGVLEDGLTVSNLDVLSDRSRLAYIDDSGILELRNSWNCKLMAELVAEKLSAKVALVTIVTDNRQIFLGQFGLDQQWAKRGETPLTHSFCKHVVASNAPLIVSDAINHPVLCDNCAVHDLGVISYLGVPLTSSDGKVVGSLCAIDDKKRNWSADEVAILNQLATSMTEAFTEKEAEKKRSQEQLLKLHRMQKLEAVGTLASSIAHDFNNLLMVIQSSVELLRLKNEDRELDRHINEIHFTVDNAKDIVGRLVAWNRQQPETLQILCLANAVRESSSLIEALMPSTVTTTFDLPAHDCPIEISPTQLTQVLLNLCANAESSMQEQGGELCISVDNSADGQWVSLIVADTGHGIPDPIKGKILEPFFSTKPNGSGIGLSMVNSIVQNHLGMIEVSDNVGGGTVFTIKLPASSLPPPQVVDLEERVDKNIKVMFVDDNVLLNKTICSHLNRSGFSVDGFSQSQLALEAFQESPEKYDVLVTDQRMPELDGLQLIREINKLSPELAVVVLTGFGHLVTDQVSKDYQINRTLQKPVGGEEISQAILELVQVTA